jgi:DeoR/GlpR family transcriptional regulator of sugar metabolism
MLPAQRQGLILAEIERSGGARIVQLAELLGVSDMMVRGDIDVLAARGLVAKVYGGATVPPQGTSDEPGFEAKSWREQAAKERIAAAAAALVQPKATIAVSAGTTTFAAAVHLATHPSTYSRDQFGQGRRLPLPQW